MKTIVTIGRSTAPAAASLPSAWRRSWASPSTTRRSSRASPRRPACGEFRPGGRAPSHQQLYVRPVLSTHSCPSPTRCLSPSPGHQGDSWGQGRLRHRGPLRRLHPARAQGAAAHLCLRASGAARSAPVRSITTRRTTWRASSSARTSSASYYNYFTSIRWGDRKSYDLCVSSRPGLDTAVEIITMRPSLGGPARLSGTQGREV